MNRSARASFAVGRAVDWELAATLGGKLARPEPPATDYTRRQSVEQLTDSARASEIPVREVTGLIEGGEIPEARIVNRPQWIRAATHSMKVMTGGGSDDGGAKPRMITGRIAGAQTAAVLAFVSSGILGQYDPFAPGGGELLLVYPNVIAVERQLRVAPADFRMWVCLHEVTHRVQFRANPWLAEHMKNALAVLTEEATDDLTEVVSRLAGYVRDRRSDPVAAEPGSTGGVLGLLRAVQSEPQREALDRLLVLGTLLEGHAEHVMDAVGPAVVPTVATIRARFDQRRQRKQSPLQRVLRALLGIDAKLSQYTRGKAFVDEVVGKVGMDRFNVVWTDAQTLPRPAEIDVPQRWIDRVL
ncbi:hydrolase [Mycolicibacterium duvalii]|uniref:Hydrolase n=1 Tax=Mycolicibacterium duvalii TaxID=39688 RepID=A0A7I7K7B6_9MYCO|nr:zinc-dependent metalloprotease [Mycolicibacterium duvalii]MCV7371088.1 zinc-dependent metalloprotease [Mycolicibacterium duvalii]PEG37179.1 hydrolase [Mycolicibacterium duvalii]BBX19985.1 hydrolase [Mycolicibacterium duvalii]